MFQKITATFRAFFKRWLSSSRVVPISVVIACVLSLPALRIPLVADDIWHRAMLLGNRSWLPTSSGPLSLYTFATGLPEERARVMESGFAPWFVSPGVRLAFFRPIASLTLALDYILWPSSPVLMHAHSIAWYAIVVLLAAKLYRRLIGPLSPYAAGLATLFYAIDYTHSLPVAWIANRNATVATAFGLFALLLHDIGARTQLRSARAPTPSAKPPRSASISILIAMGSAIGFALALGSGEGALAMIFWFAAYAIFVDTRPRSKKLVSIAPLAIVVLVWLVIYRAGRYGAFGSGVYMNPIHAPGPFFASFVVNLPLLLSTEIGAPPPDAYVFTPPNGQIAHVAVAVLVIVWAGFVFRRLIARGADPRVRRVAAFFLFGGALSVLPGTATFPSARLLFLSSFGFMGVVAMVCGGMSGANEEQQEQQQQPQSSSSSALTGNNQRLPRFVRAFTAWSWFVHLVLAPALFVLGLYGMATLDTFIKRLSEGVPSDGSAKDKRLVLVNAPDTAFAFYLVIAQLEAGRAPPSRALMMSGNVRDVRFTRTAERSFHVWCSEGFYRRGTDLLFRDTRDPMPVGTKIALSDVLITITHVTDDGFPDEASFDFTKDLDEGYVFIQWQGKALLPLTMPPVGGTIDFPKQFPNVF